MIRVICNQETFVYNAYHMVKAFYPSETVASSVDEKASNYVTVEFAEDGTDGQKEAMIEIADRQTNDMPAEKSAMKKYLDRMLYKKLSEQSGRTLAWGILMGVRPTKIAMRKLEEGMTQETFVPWFQKENLVSEEKAHLAWQIAGREKKLLDQLDYENGYSLYVGIPFCPTVCSYCSFSSGALGDWEHRVEDYLAALMKELEAIAKMSEGRKADTIYMGGGTPTTLNADQLDRLLTCIDRHFVREGLLEFTVEAGRPDSITKEKLQVLRNHGINRISINPQSMQQKTLDTIGRKHTVEQVYEAFHMARKLGFDNINMDIIAKDIIHLILCLQKLTLSDPEVSPYLKVIMVENYNVTEASHLIPACDISEQISLASKEASGTGNMKFMLNGAVTLGTMDGANVEICNLVGKDNIYIFGKSSQEVIQLYETSGYHSDQYYDNDPLIQNLVDFIISKEMIRIGDPENLCRLYKDLISKDWFMTLLDLKEYIAVKENVMADYEDRMNWAGKMLINTAKAGYFSSDRTIAEYNRDIWKL